MLTKRIIPCLDIHDRKVTKGVKFQNNVILGDPVEMAARYYAEGCDELVFYDITASAEGRVRPRVAKADFAERVLGENRRTQMGQVAALIDSIEPLATVLRDMFDEALEIASTNAAELQAWGARQPA